jgi:hypothetical protein
MLDHDSDANLWVDPSCENCFLLHCVSLSLGLGLSSSSSAPPSVVKKKKWAEGVEVFKNFKGWRHGGATTTGAVL